MLLKVSIWEAEEDGRGRWLLEGVMTDEGKGLYNVTWGLGVILSGRREGRGERGEGVVMIDGDVVELINL